VKEALDRSAGDDHVGRGEEHRLPHLMIPRPHADRQPLVAVEAGVAEDEIALLLEVHRPRPQRRLHDHLHGNPGGPVGAFHVPATGTLLEPRIDLRRAVVIPGPVPGERLQIDAADHRPRSHRAVGYPSHEVEGLVGDEHHVIVAIEGAEQQRVVLLALTWIGAGLVVLVSNNSGAEFLH
jgi:hypothetical protein